MQCHDLRVALSGRPILAGLTLAFRPGTVTAITGPNGSGKTTLLRALSGELPYRGRITLNGQDMATLPPARAAVLRAVLPQSTQVAFDFTAKEVVRLGLRTGLAAGQEDLAGAMLHRVGLPGFGPRAYHALSGGEQARVQLARVLAQLERPARPASGKATGPEGVGTSPRWLLLDEPVASLDIGHQGHVMRLMRAFAQAGGGVIAVMHDLNLTAAHVDRMVLLHRGQVVGDGAPAAVMTEPMLSHVYGTPVRVQPGVRGLPMMLPPG